MHVEGYFFSLPNGNIERILISFPPTSGFAFMFSCHIFHVERGKEEKFPTTVDDDDQQHFRVEMCHVLIFPRELLHRLPIYQSEDRKKAKESNFFLDFFCFACE